MKKFLSLLFTLVMVLAMVACVKTDSDPKASSDNKNIVLKMGSQCGEASDWVQFVASYSDKLSDLSGGTMSIEFVTGGALGTIAEHFSQMNQGTLDMMLQGCDAPSVAPGGKDFDILNLPFLFNDLDHWHKFLDSDVLKEMVNNFQKETNVLWLDVLNDSAPRALSNNKVAVKTPADLKGLNIRVPGSALQTAVWSDLGAMPINMAMSDLMEAMQTGRVDGQENGLTIVMQGYYEQQKYYTELNQTFQGIAVFMSGVTWKKLSNEQQGWVMEALEYTKEKLKKEYWDVTVPGYQKMLEDIKTIEIIPNEEVDSAAFQAIIEAHIGDYEGKFFSEGLYAKIKDLDK